MEITLNLIIQVILTILGVLISFIFSRVQKDLSRMTESVEELNVKIAVVCTKMESHERRLENLERK